MNKILYLILLLHFTLFSGLLAESGEKALSSTDTLNQFLEAAKKKNYEKMLGFMSHHFRDKISESYYYQTMKDNSFVLLESDILCANIIEDGGYFFGEFQYRVKRSKVLAWRGIFVSRIDNEWKIDSFPFDSVGIPEFIELPKGLSKGVYHFNE